MEPISTASSEGHENSPSPSSSTSSAPELSGNLELLTYSCFQKVDQCEKYCFFAINCNDVSLTGTKKKRKLSGLMQSLFSEAKEEREAHLAVRLKFCEEAERKEQAKHEENVNVKKDLVDVLRSAFEKR